MPTTGTIVLPTDLPVTGSLASTDQLMVLVDPTGTPLSKRAPVSQLSAALALGNAATKNVGTAAGDVAAGNAAAGLITALALGNAATKNVGTAAGDVAAGNAAAGLITALALGNASTKNVGTTAGTVAAGDDSRFGLTTSMPATYFVTTAQCTGSAAAVRATLQGILDSLVGVPTRIILPSMVIVIAEGAHPSGTGFGRIGLALRIGNILHLSAGTTLRLDTTTTLTAETRFIVNWNMNTGGTTDTDFAIEGEGYTSVLDGSGGTVSSGSLKCHGIQFWRASRAAVRNMRVINFNGYNTGAGEAFLVDYIRCNECVTIDVVSDRTAGTTASHFSASFCDNMKWIRCTGRRSTNGHGFTLYSSGRCTYTDCLAEDNASVGFNEEHSWDFKYVNCISGGIQPWTTDSSVASYTPGTTKGNAGAGWNINFTLGGGGGSLVNCSSKNNDKGITILGGVNGTATTGTTGSAVVATTSIFTKAMIGRWISINGGNPSRITGYTNGTTVATTPAHGGATGNTIEVWGGELRVASDCTFADNTTSGCQFSNGGGVGTKRNDIRMTRFAPGCSFYGNPNDFVDVGNGSGVSLVTFVAGYRILDTLSSNWVTATTFVNPFPFDVMIMAVGTTAATTIGSKYAPVTQNSTGVNSGSFMLGAGASITITSTTQIRFFII